MKHLMSSCHMDSDIMWKHHCDKWRLTSFSLCFIWLQLRGLWRNPRTGTRTQRGWLLSVGLVRSDPEHEQKSIWILVIEGMMRQNGSSWSQRSIFRCLLVFSSVAWVHSVSTSLSYVYPNLRFLVGTIVHTKCLWSSYTSLLEENYFVLMNVCDLILVRYVLYYCLDWHPFKCALCYYITKSSIETGSVMWWCDSLRARFDKLSISS